MEFLKFKYPDWSTYSPEKREQLMTDFEQEFENSLTGVDNGGKMITTYYSEASGNMELLNIDDKSNKNTWLPSSIGAENELLNAFAYHSSQMSMGNHSGSDAMAHFNIGILRNTMQQMELLEPLNHVFQKNNWDVVAMIEDLGQTTLDKNKSGIMSNSLRLENA